MTSLSSCTCPQCQTMGTLLSSIHKAETLIHTKNGMYKGIIQSERARLFPEPKRNSSMPLITLGAFVGVGLFSVAGLHLSSVLQFGAIGTKATSLVNTQQAPEPFNNLINVLDYLPTICIGFIILGIIMVSLNRKHAEQTMVEQDAEFEKNLARYRSLYYCERCDIVYDQEQRSHPATETGFETAMRYY